METTVKSLGMDTTAAHTLLPEVHQPVYTCRMQVYAHMLAVCQGGNNKTRANKRTVACYMENPQVQPMGRQWLRSGTVSTVL